MNSKLSLIIAFIFFTIGIYGMGSMQYGISMIGLAGMLCFLAITLNEIFK